MVMLILGVLLVPVSFADDICFVYSVRTDSDLYHVGDRVHWTVSGGVAGHWKASGGVEGNCDGVAGFDIDLHESKHEVMEAPYMEPQMWSNIDFRFHPSYVKEEYFSTGIGIFYYNVNNGFQADTPFAGAGLVSGIGVSQFIYYPDQGLCSYFVDDDLHPICEASYTVTKAGVHDLDPSGNSGAVWIGNEAVSIYGGGAGSGVAFYVYSTPSADPGSTNMSTLSVISNSWDNIDCSDSNNFCEGADVNLDGEVNDLDVSDLFFDGGSNFSVEDDIFVHQDVIIPAEEHIAKTASFNLKSIRAFGAPASGNVSFSDITNSAAKFSNLGRRIMFSANNGVDGAELWTVADGNVESFDLNLGESSSEPQLFTKHGSTVYFVARDSQSGWSLYAIGRDAATKALKPPVRIKEDLCNGDGAELLSLTSFRGGLYFTVVAGNERQLWCLDRPTETPHQVADMSEPVAAPAHLTAAGPHLFFVTYDDYRGYRLSRSDGVSIVPVRDFGWNEPSSLTTVGARVFFKTCDGLWISDGTTEGTLPVAAVKVESDPLQPLCVWNEAVFFAAYEPDSGIELWTSDGVETHVVRDLTPGPASSLVPNLQAMPRGVVFSTTTAPDQACLWLTDGTAEGTECLADFSTADGSAIRLHQFHRFMGRNLYFLANDQLLRYRGTTDELALLTDSQGNLPPDNIRYITTASDKLVIITDQGEAGQGLWLYGSEN